MSKHPSLSRRGFLKRAGVGFAAAGVAPMFVPSSAFGAADRVNLAVVGLRGRGGSHINNFGKLPDVHLAQVVDIDANLFSDRVSEIQQKFGYEARTLQDFRRVLDDPDIDAVAFAVPNHWHALASIWAAQAGKHIYVEKPASHGIWEGRQMVNAARKHGVLMQVGFQNRSRANTTAAIKFLRDGGIGKVYMARGLCHKPRRDIGRYPDGPMPQGSEPFSFTVDGPPAAGPYTRDYLSRVDYDMWQGPAPARPFNRNRFHYNWHWNWDYGNGDTGNQGPHQFDVARWGLGKDEHPVKVSSKGGYFIYDSAQNTPNTQTSLFEYEDGTILEFSTRGLPTNAEGHGIMIGDIFYGADGRLEIDGGGNWKTYMGHRDEPGPDSSNFQVDYDPNDLVGGGDSAHFANFIKAVRSGNQADLTCDIEEGHRSSALAHMGNIAYRVGRELRFDDATERFVGDPDANALLRRDYRAPYVVPEIAT